MTHPKDKVPVSILIPIKNEASNLARCLASVAWAAEIFVVDSQSSDGSIQIAEAHGAKIVQFEFNGIWPKKKNWALDKLPFSYEWVFILDADETLPPAAEAEFRAIVSRPVNSESDVIAYWINRRMMFMNKWMKHAYYPNWNLRLFLHKNCRYEKLINEPTASGDNEVHEHVIVNGRTEQLKSEMEHYAFPTVEVFVEKHNRYSNWEARYSLSQRKGIHEAANLDNKEVNLTRRLKKIMQFMPFRPLLRFFYVYIWQKGFLDGMEGYYFACLHGFYEFLTVTKIYELKKAQERANRKD